MNPDIQLVLFDLDDTLFDHRHSSRSALSVLQDRYTELKDVHLDNLELQNLEILNRIHLDVLRGIETVDSARIKRFTELLGMHKVNTTVADIQECSEIYRNTYLSSRKPVKGAIQLLTHLRQFVKVGIVTNNLVEEQMGKLKVCGLEPLIDVLVISEEVSFSKPDPKIFEIALVRAGVEAPNTVMIGDSWEVDILGACAANIRPIWFNYYGRPIQDNSVIAIDSFQPIETVHHAIFSDIG